MKTRLMVCGVWGAAVLASGQSLSVGQGGSIGLSDRGESSIVKSVPSVQAGRELAMAGLPVTEAPPEFYLNYGTSMRYGPYALADNTPVGNKQAPYTLHLFDYGDHFTLRAPDGTNAVYGPFSATNGAFVKIGSALMRVVRFPPQLKVTLNHPDKTEQRPLLGIAPYTPTLMRELYALRTKYVALANRVESDTADIEFANMPTVHSRLTGNTFVPTVRTSRRDRQNAVKSAELGAVSFLETLFEQAFPIRSQAITDGSTYHFGMPPGEYVFCAMQKVRDPHAQGVAAATTAVWWTTFRFDGEHPLTLSLTAENAITWREIFTLDVKP